MRVRPAAAAKEAEVPEPEVRGWPLQPYRQPAFARLGFLRAAAGRRPLRGCAARASSSGHRRSFRGLQFGSWLPSGLRPERRIAPRRCQPESPLPSHSCQPGPAWTAAAGLQTRQPPDLQLARSPRHWRSDLPWAYRLASRPRPACDDRPRNRYSESGLPGLLRQHRSRPSTQRWGCSVASPDAPGSNFQGRPTDWPDKWRSCSARG